MERETTTCLSCRKSTFSFTLDYCTDCLRELSAYMKDNFKRQRKEAVSIQFLTEDDLAEMDAVELLSEDEISKPTKTRRSNSNLDGDFMTEEELQAL